MFITRKSRLKARERAEREGVNEATGKYANDWKLELLALFGFCASGVIFVIAGLRSGDMLTVFGSVVWIVACVCWMVPFRKYF